MSIHPHPSALFNSPSSNALTDLLKLPAELSHYKKHFTASAVVMEQSHILLVHHRRIGAWLPPGGHIEEYELPHETAIRETKEETGVQIFPLSPNFPIPNTENENAFFLPAPLCIHAVKAREKDCDYYHVDLAYLCLPVMDPADTSLPKTILSEEVHESRWVALDALSQLPLANNVVEIVALAKSRLNLT